MNDLISESIARKEIERRNERVSELEGQNEQLRSALQRIAGYIGASCSDKASHTSHLLIADEVPVVVSRLTKERDAALAEIADLLDIIKVAGAYIDDHTRPDVTGERDTITLRIHAALARNVRNDT